MLTRSLSRFSIAVTLGLALVLVSALPDRAAAQYNTDDPVAKEQSVAMTLTIAGLVVAGVGIAIYLATRSSDDEANSGGDDTNEETPSEPNADDADEPWNDTKTVEGQWDLAITHMGNRGTSEYDPGLIARQAAISPPALVPILALGRNQVNVGFEARF